MLIHINMDRDPSWYQTTSFVNSLDHINCILYDDGYIIPKTTCIWGDRYIIEHRITDYNDLKSFIFFHLFKKQNNTHFIQIWKSKSFFDLYYDNPYSTRNYIATLEYKIMKDHVKIVNIFIYDNENTPNRLSFCLNDEESKTLNISIIQYLKNLAIKHKQKR